MSTSKQRTLDDRAPAASILLIHGAGSGPWIFKEWFAHFPHLVVKAIDLQAGLDVNRASMAQYACAAVEAAGQMPQPVSLCGWSMGGLAAESLVKTAERRRQQ